MALKCKDPTLCYTKGTSKIYRSWSMSSPIFKQIAQSVFNCGKCSICRKKKSQELAMRCVLHASLYLHNCFLTLTYDEKRESYHNRFDYTDIQKFKKRLRRHCEPKKIQIFNVHEYGKNGKKHWHLVVFNHDFDDKTHHTTKNGHLLFTSKTLEKLWPHGFNTIGNITEASAMYTAQYTQKDFKYDHIGTFRKSHSKHSGIGRDYFLQHYEQILTLGFIPFNSRKVPIPRYFYKLAHKQYSHFFEPQNFINFSDKKRLYTPIPKGQENLRMALLFQRFFKERQIKIDDLKRVWDADIQQFIFTDEKPDFVKSGENMEYDLKNKINSNQF